MPAAELIEIARARGLELGDEEISELVRTDSANAARASETFGFSAGMDAAAIKRTALAALGASNQNVVLVREDVLGIKSILLTLYPVTDSRGTPVPKQER